MAYSPGGLPNSIPLRLVLLSPNAALVGAFIVASAGIVIATIWHRETGFSLQLYGDVLSSPVIQSVALRTLWITLATTLTCLLLGYPIAAFIARSRNSDLLLILIISPWLISIVVRTFAWIVVLGNRGVLNATLQALGIIDSPMRILFTPVGTLIGLVHVMLPFMVLSILSVLLQMDRKLEEASMILGAGPVQTFFRVSFPLALPGLLSGCSLVLLLASGAIITPLLLGGLRDRMMGTQIYQEMFFLFDFERAAALSVLLLLGSLVLVIPLQLIEGRIRRSYQT